MSISRHFHFFILITTLLLTSLACRALLPKAVPPGSFEAQVAEGNMVFTGTGNVVYIGCQDPTAVVTLSIAAPTKEIDGITFTAPVNPVTVSAVTNGTQVKTNECQKVSTDETYNWPASGLYYAGDNRILFNTCTASGHRAEGEAFLVGEGFEGEYACYDKDTGALMYEVAISAYQVSP